MGSRTGRKTRRFVHYLREHHVKPPQEFLDHVLRKATPKLLEQAKVVEEFKRDVERALR